MTKVSLPRYLRFGVRTNKSLEQIRREALEAERYERRRVWRSRLGRVGDFVGRVLNFILPSKLSLLILFNIIITILALPIGVLVGAIAGPRMILANFFESGGRRWPTDWTNGRRNF